MSLIVETGTGAADSESYASIATINAYALAHGHFFAIGTSAEIALAEEAARRATQWIDGTYRSRFPGYRTNGRLQALEWPRLDASDNSPDPNAIDSDEIPHEVVDATCEAAIRELADPSSLAPDLERGGAIKRLKAGSVELEYAGNASVRTVYTLIDRIMAPILTVAISGLTGRAVRG